MIKQADLLLAQYWFGDRFDDENKAPNVDYYERRTVRDSSLSAAVQAVTAAEVGHLELAYDYVYEAAQIDLRDLDHNSGDGMHIASLASVWTALVAGFGGMREYQGQLSFAPQLPDLITRLCFNVQWRGLRLEVDIEPGRAIYELRDRTDATLAFRHHGEEVTVTAGKPVTALISKRPPLLPRPPQPPGRKPLHQGESQSSSLPAGPAAAAGELHLLPAEASASRYGGAPATPGSRPDMIRAKGAGAVASPKKR